MICFVRQILCQLVKILFAIHGDPTALQHIVADVERTDLILDSVPVKIILYVLVTRSGLCPFLATINV